MKSLLFLLTTLVCAPAAHSAILINVPVNKGIPDGDLAGLTSSATVSGASGTVQSLQVNLTIEGTYNGDLYAYLSHGSGLSVLLNRPGRTAIDGLGYGDPGLNVTFSDAALVDIHNYGGTGGNTLNGTFQPDGRYALPGDVLATTARTAMLSSFGGMDPNGDWVLFVADAQGGDLHQLINWDLEVTVVPESQCWWIATLPLLAVYLRRCRAK